MWRRRSGSSCVCAAVQSYDAPTVPPWRPIRGAPHFSRFVSEARACDSRGAASICADAACQGRSGSRSAIRRFATTPYPRSHADPIHLRRLAHRAPGRPVRRLAVNSGASGILVDDRLGAYGPIPNAASSETLSLPRGPPISRPQAAGRRVATRTRSRGAK